MAAATSEGDSVRFPLVLGPYETKVVVVGPLPSGVAAPEPSLVSGNTLAELGGEWTLDLNGKQVTTALKPWEELGTASFAGPATYRKQFTVSAAPAGKRVFLEMADVHEYARVKLNGKELEGHAWPPYRWDVTNAVKAGSNDLEVEVRTTAGGRGGFGGGAPPAAAAAPGAAGAAGAAGGRGGRGGRGQAAPGAAGAPGAGAAGAGGQAAMIGTGASARGRGSAPPPTSGLLGPVRLVAR
jgi:hypothetical protein